MAGLRFEQHQDVDDATGSETAGRYLRSPCGCRLGPHSAAGTQRYWRRTREDWRSSRVRAVTTATAAAASPSVNKTTESSAVYSACFIASAHLPQFISLFPEENRIFKMGPLNPKVWSTERRRVKSGCKCNQKLSIGGSYCRQYGPHFWYLCQLWQREMNSCCAWLSCVCSTTVEQLCGFKSHPLYCLGSYSYIGHYRFVCR